MNPNAGAGILILVGDSLSHMVSSSEDLSLAGLASLPTEVWRVAIESRMPWISIRIKRALSPQPQVQPIHCPGGLMHVAPDLASIMHINTFSVRPGHIYRSKFAVQDFSWPWAGTIECAVLCPDCAIHSYKSVLYLATLKVSLEWEPKPYLPGFNDVQAMRES